MKSFKLLVTGFFVLVSSLTALPSLAEPVSNTVVAEDVLRAANDNQQHLLQIIRELKGQKNAPILGLKSLSSSTWRPHCDDDDDNRQTCVPRCSVRFSNGSCGSYGADFCAPEASCVEKCSVRFSNGTCGSYAADHCGSNAHCSENCTVRFSDGSCGSYGPDICY